MIPLTDEEYYRNRRTPIITYLLIALNVFFFFWARESDIDVFGLHAGSITAGTDWITLITSTFLHANFLHLLFNMWSLWIFGDNVEDDLGPIGYLFLYFASAIVGGYLFAILANPADVAIGASGAIAGVMAAYLVLHPKNKVLTLLPLGIIFTTIRINAPIFIGIWFLLQFVGLSGGSDGVAYSAHIGGFITGLILAFILRKKRPTPLPVNPY